MVFAPPSSIAPRRAAAERVPKPGGKIDRLLGPCAVWWCGGGGVLWWCVRREQRPGKEIGTVKDKTPGWLGHGSIAEVVSRKHPRCNRHAPHALGLRGDKQQKLDNSTVYNMHGIALQCVGSRSGLGGWCFYKASFFSAKTAQMGSFLPRVMPRVI